MELTFYGAAGTVTGSKFLLKTHSGRRILIDCGMYQGETDSDAQKKANELPFDASIVDDVLLTHAHIDHSGLLPLLAKHGFKGKVYCTEATADLLSMMLYDSAHIQEQDLQYINRVRSQKDLSLIEPLYGEQDVRTILDQLVVIDNQQTFEIQKNIFVKPFFNGHILGSVGYHITEKQKGNKQVSIFFTGDIGRPSDPLLPDPLPFTQADYIVCESTYGDRIHPPFIDIEPLLLEVIQRVCVQRKGKIVIPAFSVDRTQELIYLIDRLYHAGKLPKIHVYVDSPMSVKATRIIKQHMYLFNRQAKDYILEDGDPFCFPKLRYVETVEESKAINADDTPAIIISASGMAEAGRVKHHIKNLIGSSDHMILLVGYATPESLAGKLRRGITPVRIFGEFLQVHAEIGVMDYFSAHADQQEMLDYLSCQDPSFVQTVFLVHGKNQARDAFKQVLIEKGGFSDVKLPLQYETFTLS
jgi:metallo-beta-lactamase family protein